MTLCELDRLRNLVIRSEIKRTDIIEEMVFKSYLFERYGKGNK